MTDYAEVDPSDVEGVKDGNPALVVPMITVMAKAYTRGRGFTGKWPNDEVAAVIKSASVRFVSNPSQLGNLQTTGPFTQDFRAGFNGWTLAELAVLNRYRARAM